MKKIGIIIGVFTVLSTLSASTALAAKARVRAASTSSVVKKAATGVSFSSAKLSRGTNSVVLSFKNLDRASKVSYLLSYNANGIDQGAAGSITPSGTSDSRDLYFGTCSKGVCTPHGTIKNASLVVTTSLKTGGTNTKRYTIKF